METIKIEKNYEPSEAEETPGNVARRNILKIAKAWEKKGELFQATPVYEYLIDKTPESTEAKEAKETLLKIAQYYQKLDANYCALSLYKYLLEAEKARCGHED